MGDPALPVPQAQLITHRSILVAPQEALVGLARSINRPVCSQSEGRVLGVCGIMFYPELLLDC